MMNSAQYNLECKSYRLCVGFWGHRKSTEMWVSSVDTLEDIFQIHEVVQGNQRRFLTDVGEEVFAGVIGGYRRRVGLTTRC